MPEPPAVPADYVLETSTGVRVITSARSADAAFVGAMDGLAPGEHRRVHRYADFEQAGSPADRDTPLGLAIRQFFVNGGDTAHVFGRVAGPVDATRLRDALAAMVAALDLAAGETDAPDFQLLCVPEAFDLPEAEAIAFMPPPACARHAARSSSPTSRAPCRPRAPQSGRRSSLRRRMRRCTCRRCGSRRRRVLASSTSAHPGRSPACTPGPMRSVAFTGHRPA
jgi:hypothetical protein